MSADNIHKRMLGDIIDIVCNTHNLILNGKLEVVDKKYYLDCLSDFFSVMNHDFSVKLKSMVHYFDLNYRHLGHICIRNTHLEYLNERVGIIYKG